MPSTKVQAAVDGRATYTTRKSAVKTRVRESVVPEDPDLAKVQQDLRQSVDKMLKGTPLADGRLVDATFGGASESGEFAHELGGPAKGFIVVDMIPTEDPPSAVPSIWRLKDKPGRENSHIRLNCTIPCAAKVWVWR